MAASQIAWVFLHRFHRHLEIRRVVQRIKNAEDIDALCGGMFDETGYDIIRVIGIPHRVRAAKQHLETDVRGSARADSANATTDLSCRKRMAVSNVAPPHNSRLNNCGARRATAPAMLSIVVGADACGEQRLMGVAERGVRDEQALLFERPFREFLRPEFEQELARTRSRFRFGIERGDRNRRERGATLPASLRDRIAVHDDVRDERQQLGGAIAARFELEQFRRGIDQRRRGETFAEGVVVDDVFEKRGCSS